jgi:hypothetical protein
MAPVGTLSAHAIDVDEAGSGVRQL